MSDSNRNSITVTWIAVAIVFASIVGYFAWNFSGILTEQRVREEKTAEYHDKYAEDRIDEKCLSLEAIAMRDCIHEEIEAARDHERSEQDLDAQQAMAIFTRLMGYTAVIGLILGAVSIGVIFFTLREMRRTNSIMQSERRPWMQFSPSLVAYERDGVKRASVGFKPKNVGGSPAYKVAFQIHELETPERVDPLAEIQTAILRANTMPARAGVVFPNSTPTQKVTANIIMPDGEKTASKVCTCAVLYSSGGEGVSYTAFCWMVTVRAKNGLTFGDSDDVDGNDIALAELASDAG